MPDSFTNWLKFTPAGVPNYRRSYIDLPSFSYSGLSWSGASIIVAQFNFSATSNFILLNRPSKPLNVNYGLCVRYRVGETVYRYKLWQDTNFVLNDDGAPIYNGQIIKKNFVLEIWSLNGQSTASQASSIRMFSSLRSLPTDINVTTDYALAVGAEFTALDNTNTYSLPTTGLVFDLNASNLAVGAITSWIDSKNGANMAGTATCAQDTKFNSQKYVNFDGVSDYLSGVAPYFSGISPFDIWMVFSKWGNTGATHEYLYNAAHGDDLSIANANSTQLMLSAAGNFISPIGLAVDEEIILETIIRAPATPCSIQKNDETAVTGTLGAFNDWLNTAWFIGKGLVGGFTKPNIARILAYTGEQSAADRLATKQYLANLYQGAIALDMSFNAGGAWLDNV